MVGAPQPPFLNMVKYLRRSGFLTPAINIQCGVSQVLSSPGCHVQGSEKQIVADSVGNFRISNTGCMIQTLHE